MKRCDDINELHPKVKELAAKLLAEAKKQGLNAKIIDTYRSKERQDWLYAQGRTRPGNIVTNAKGSSMSSYHNWRLAFDVIQNVPGKEYDALFLNRVGKIGEALGLEWGGSWTRFKDRPHFQYTFGLSIADLRAGKKPPSYISFDQEYKKAVDKLVAEGIITQMPVWWPKVNLNNAQHLIRSFGLKVFGRHTYQECIQALAENRISVSPLVWLNRTYTEENLKMLVINMAKYLG